MVKHDHMNRICTVIHAFFFKGETASSSASTSPPDVSLLATPPPQTTQCVLPFTPQRQSVHARVEVSPNPMVNIEASWSETMDIPDMPAGVKIAIRSSKRPAYSQRKKIIRDVVEAMAKCHPNQNLASVVLWQDGLCESIQTPL